MKAASIDISKEHIRLDELAPAISRTAWAVGLIGIAASALLGFMVGGEAFLRGYVMNFCYFLSLSLGALFWVMLQHLTRSGWSVVIRRLGEAVMSVLPFLAVLFLPIPIALLAGVGGVEQVFPWADSAKVAGDELLRLKQPYLNVPFFLVRCLIYFAVWSWLSTYFFRKSVEQDTTGDPNLTVQMGRTSAPGMLLYAFTVTFFAFDLLMSLEPHWFSTIFGVYYFSGGVVSFFALLVLLMVLMQNAGRMTRAITVEHYHDTGKLLFAFTVFWAYIAFSQYMLIWYANLPEETIWFLARQSGVWLPVSLVLLFGHFVAPFLGLISRFPKRRRNILILGAAWILLMHWVDMLWLVKPVAPIYAGADADVHSAGTLFSIVDITLFVGLGGLFTAVLVTRLGRAALLPHRDPRLVESLAFENY